jgi:hypothetical protein
MKLPPYSIKYSSKTKWGIYYLLCDRPLEWGFETYQLAKIRRFKMLKGAGRITEKAIRPYKPPNLLTAT